MKTILIASLCCLIMSAHHQDKEVFVYITQPAFVPFKHTALFERQARNLASAIPFAALRGK